MTAAQAWASNLCGAIADELNGKIKPEIVSPYIRLASLMLTKSLWIQDGTRRLLSVLLDEENQP